MTEELKKEAEEKASVYFNSLDIDNGNVSDTPFSAYDVFVAYEKGALDFAEPREVRIAELEAQIEKMKSQYDYAFNQLRESREIVCLMLSQYKNKKEIDYSTKERGEKLLKQGVYKYD